MLAYTPIPKEQIRQFDEQGYLIVRNALDQDTIAHLIEVSDRIIASDSQANRQPNRDGYSDGFRNCVTLDDAFIPLITHPKMLPLVIHLLGANLQLMTSHLIYRYPQPQDDPDVQRKRGWHRDYAQAMNDLGHFSIPRIELKCAYYFTDLSQPGYGSTRVVPGSNQLKEPIVIPEDEVDPEGALEPLLNPGDCLIFENRTWHTASPNLADWTRKCVMIGYGYRWVTPMDFRKQDADFVEKLSPLERYLVGEQWDDEQSFQFDGGANPLRDWCNEHGLPVSRHVGPDNTIQEVWGNVRN